MADPDLDSTTLTQRLVLLGVAAHAAEGRTPAHSADVEATCREHVDAVAADVLGSVSEGDVMRTLNELEAAGFLEMVDVADASAVGKGRPCYELRVAHDALLDALSADDRLEGVVDRVRDRPR